MSAAATDRPSGSPRRRPPCIGPSPYAASVGDTPRRSAVRRSRLRLVALDLAELRSAFDAAPPQVGGTGHLGGHVAGAGLAATRG